MAGSNLGEMDMPSAKTWRRWPMVAGGMWLAVSAAGAAPLLNDTGLTQCLVTKTQQWTSRCQGSPQDAGTGRDTTHPDAADGWAGFSWQAVCHNGERAGEGVCPADPAWGEAAQQQGCTWDAVTGLLWENKTFGVDDWRYYRQQYRHVATGETDAVVDFIQRVNAQGLCGRHHWRLPTVRELQGLVMYDDRPTPWVDPAFWPDTQAWTYWTRDTSATQPQAVGWVVSFGDGTVLQDSRQAYHAVRLVHDDATGGAGPRWVPVAGGQDIHDTWTGLVWRRCAQGQTWNGRTCRGAVVGFRWQPALTHSQTWARRTGQPWRLPNVKELGSVIERGAAVPTLNRVAFPGMAEQPFWTSTAVSSINRESWQVDTASGEVRPGFQNEQKGVWLVRDAP